MRYWILAIWIVLGCSWQHEKREEQKESTQNDVERVKTIGPSERFTFAPIVAGKPAANASVPDGLPPHGDLLSVTAHAGGLETLKDLSRKQEELNRLDKGKTTPAIPVLRIAGALFALAVGAYFFIRWRMRSTLPHL